MIFVAVGSRNYPFDRLLKKLDSLYEQGILTEEMFAQTGTSKYVPKHYQHKDFIPREEFTERMKNADIIVSHGASGTIMTALNMGKKVIAVSRLKKYHEHINDHQVQNNEALSVHGYVLMADPELDNLAECFEKIYSGTDGIIPWKNEDPMSVINMVDNFIESNWKKR